VNIDCRKDVEPDILIDLENELLQRFNDESVDEILAKDFIEHLSWRIVETFLRDCFRVLKKDGKIYIQTPDLEAIAKKVILNPNFKYGNLSEWQAISFWVYGAQDYENNLHKTGFTIPTLKNLLESIGFKIDSIKNDSGTNIVCHAHK